MSNMHKKYALMSYNYIYNEICLYIFFIFSPQLYLDLFLC